MYTELDATAGGFTACDNWCLFIGAYWSVPAPANFAFPFTAATLGCPNLPTSTPAPASYGSGRFYKLPMGLPSEGSTLHLDMCGSDASNHYEVFLGRGCPSDYATFQCVAWAALPCLTAACCRAPGAFIDYTFTARDAATSDWFVIFINTDHSVTGHPVLNWESGGKFLPTSYVSAAPLVSASPHASPTPPPSAGSAATVLPNLYPFGPGVGDATIGRSDDGVGALALPLPLPAFSSPATTAFISTNGVISLGRSAETAYVAQAQPRSDTNAVIAPFWTDIDTRGPPPNVNNTGTHDGGGGVVPNRVYYRVVTAVDAAAGTPNASALLAAALSDVSVFFPAFASTFTGVETVVVATWYAVGAFPAQTNATNSFQAVLVSDGVFTFAMLRYASIQWVAPPLVPGLSLGGPPASAEVDAGSNLGGVTLPGSLSSDVAGLTSGSNVGVPGVWAYRIDTAGSVLGGCAASGTPADSAAHASLTPRVGSALGGTTILVSGPCFHPTDSIQCRFGDSVVVAGTYVSLVAAACVAPFISRAADVTLFVSANGPSSPPAAWIPVGVFSYLSPHAPQLPTVAFYNLNGTGNASTSAAAGARALGLNLPGDALLLYWYVPTNMLFAGVSWNVTVNEVLRQPYEGGPLLPLISGAEGGGRSRRLRLFDGDDEEETGEGEQRGGGFTGDGADGHTAGADIAATAAAARRLLNGPGAVTWVPSQVSTRTVSLLTPVGLTTAVPSDTLLGGSASSIADAVEAVK